MKGYIYILKNPSFENYVKIGYADDVEVRLQKFNNSECVPFAFRVYATYEVESRLLDKKIHSIIDKLNPNLRSKEVYNGKSREREFFAMTAEEAYSIFECIAEINNCMHKLKKWELSSEEKIAEEIAEVVTNERRARSANFTFSECGIPIGTILVNIDDPTITCTVVDDRRIEYNGEIMYVTPFVKKISGKNYITHGPGYLLEHFSYNGELLQAICDRLGV